jgi:hypothetical protein
VVRGDAVGQSHEAQCVHRHADVDEVVFTGDRREGLGDGVLGVVGELRHVGAGGAPAPARLDELERCGRGEVAREVERALGVEALGESVRRPPRVDERVELVLEAASRDEHRRSAGCAGELVQVADPEVALEPVERGVVETRYVRTVDERGDAAATGFRRDRLDRQQPCRRRRDVVDDEEPGA